MQAHAHHIARNLTEDQRSWLIEHGTDQHTVTLRSLTPLVTRGLVDLSDWPLSISLTELGQTVRDILLQQQATEASA